MSKLSIAVKEGRRFSDPVNPNRFSFSGFVPLEEVGKLRNGQIPWVNPRLASPTSKMARTIRLSALENRGRFHELNRGATLIGDDGKLEPSGILTVDFGSTSKKRGLLDGGTTVSGLAEELVNGFQQGANPAEKQYMKIQVLCGAWTDEEVEDLAGALNTSVQVDSFSLANFSGAFQGIEKALSKAPFRICYFMGDAGDVNIEDVIQWLALLTMDEPQSAYTSKEKCLEHFEKNQKVYSKYEGPILSDIIRLAEYIPLQAKAVYNADGGKFGRLSVISDSTKGSKYLLPVHQQQIDYAPHKAWVFPVLAAFRPCIDASKSPFEWKTNKGGHDPFGLFDKLGAALLAKVNRSYNSLGTLNAVGKNPDLYDALMAIVERAVK